MSGNAPQTVSPLLRVHGALLAVSAIYGFFYIAMKLLLIHVAQEELILLRFVLTALIVWLLELLFFRSKIKDVLKVTGLAILGVFMVQILLVNGVHRTTAFHSALIMSTVPMITLSFSLMLRRETYHWQKLVGILLAFTGVSLLLTSKNQHQLLPTTYISGDILILIAAFAFSAFLLMSQDLLNRYNSYSLMAYSYIISAGAYCVTFFGHRLLSGVSKPFNLDFIGRLSTPDWVLVLYMVIFASIITYTLNNYALRRVSPTIVSAYTFLQPILSAILGYYILQEPFTPIMIIATMVTFGGIFMASLASQRDLRRSATLHPELTEAAEETPSVL